MHDPRSSLPAITTLTLVLFTDQENIPARVGVPGAVREERYSLRGTTGLLLLRATSRNSPFATKLAHAHMSQSYEQRSPG